MRPIPKPVSLFFGREGEAENTAATAGDDGDHAIDAKDIAGFKVGHFECLTRKRFANSLSSLVWSGRELRRRPRYLNSASHSLKIKNRR